MFVLLLVIICNLNPVIYPQSEKALRRGFHFSLECTRYLVWTLETGPCSTSAAPSPVWPELRLCLRVAKRSLVCCVFYALFVDLLLFHDSFSYLSSPTHRADGKPQKHTGSSFSKSSAGLSAVIQQVLAVATCPQTLSPRLNNSSELERGFDIFHT